MTHRHHRGAGPAVGAFWLSITALVLVLVSGPGCDAGAWSARVGFFLLQWGAYQGVFGASFAGGVLVDDRRRAAWVWCAPALIAGLAAAGAAYCHLGFPS